MLNRTPCPQRAPLSFENDGFSDGKIDGAGSTVWAYVGRSNSGLCGIWFSIANNKSGVKSGRLPISYARVALDVICCDKQTEYFWADNVFTSLRPLGLVLIGLCVRFIESRTSWVSSAGNNILYEIQLDIASAQNGQRRASNHATTRRQQKDSDITINWLWCIIIC